MINAMRYTDIVNFLNKEALIYYIKESKNTALSLSFSVEVHLYNIHTKISHKSINLTECSKKLLEVT